MIERLAVGRDDAPAIARHVRGYVPAPAAVHEVVAGIVASVEEGGDEALVMHERRFGGGDAPLRVPVEELAAALDALDPAVRAGLELARANVGRVAEAGLSEDRDVGLPEGHVVRLRELPVARAAVYAPGGRQPYPSSVVMGVVTARAAGVEQVVVAAPAHPVILAACALCGADEVYRMGGAQAIAALALGTETIAPVDVIVGPGNLYVQEAKRQLSGRVGIDGFAGPSDLLVLASAGADPGLLALDLLAQAEHGADSLVVAVSDDASLLDAIGRAVQDRFGARDTVAAGPKVLVDAPDLEAALAFSEALAPEHLELVGEAAEALAPRVTRAGCLFVGAASATAFGDYVAGSNHTLPTDGAARFASGLGVGHFRRRMSEVRIGDAASALARADVPIAEAEGFAVHAESMSRHAQLSRRTGETDVTVALDLDGGVAQQIATGVGFFDHMLDLLARHGRLGLGVTVQGDLETGAHHTVEDTGIVLGQALGEALGDRAGIRRYGHAVVPMDEARAACAIDISGRPYCTVEGLELPAGAIAGFEHEAAEEFFRAVASAARLTLHLELQAGTNAHHMIEACFKAFARALRGAVSVDPDETGVPSTKGTLT